MKKERFWEKVYNKNAARIKGICKRYVGSDHVAEDLMQDTFLQAINKYDGFSGKGSFEGWLYRIAVNTALQYLRMQNKKNDNDLLQHELFENNQENEPEIKTVRQIIEQAGFTDDDLLEVLTCLPTAHQQVFNLYVIDNFTHAEIARQLEISEGTSKSHLARARKKLQQLLYEKALEKEKENRKRRLGFMAIFPLFKCNGIFPDSLFIKKLKGYSAAPTGSFGTIAGKVSWNSVKMPAIKAIVSTYITNYLIIGVTCLGITGGSLFIYISHSNTLAMPPVNTTRAVIFKDSAGISPSTGTETVDDTAKPLQIKPEKVVIYKKQVKRQTVIIRDTVIVKR